MKRTLLSAASRTLLLSLLAGGALAPAWAQMPFLPQPEVQVEENRTGEETDPFEGLDKARIPAGRLLDRAPAFVDVSLFDGGAAAPPANLATWREIYHALVRSGGKADASSRALPDLDGLHAQAARLRERGVVPIALQHVRYGRLRAGAVEQGLLREEGGRLVEVRGRPGTPYEARRAFAAAVYAGDVHAERGSVRFVLDPTLIVGGEGERPQRVRVDLGDGAGYREVRLGDEVVGRYAEPGEKTVRVVSTYDGEEIHAEAVFTLASTSVPPYDNYWIGSSVRPYAGGYAGYDAVVFYGQGNTSLRRPVVVVEGFDENAWDPVTRRTWQQIYGLLERDHNLATRLRAHGYDLVIMKLHDAGGYIQRNAFALEHLLGMVKTQIPAGERAVVIGPSMGGLVARYALASMERAGMDHGVRLSVSFDTPHGGANVPLGMQYLTAFFASNSDSQTAADRQRSLDQVAALQMLALHYDLNRASPMRAAFTGELNQLGYPRAWGIRNVALVNGSGHALAQQGNSRVWYRRMNPGDQIFEWRHRNIWVDIDGNAWAVPNVDPWTRIFYGRIDKFGPHYRSLDVSVQGTAPFDSSPGGARFTMQAAAGPMEGYGTSTTSFPGHAFVPTVSGLDLPTSNLYYHVANDPSQFIATHSDGRRSTANFDAIFYPQDNEEHLTTTSQSATFLLQQIDPAIPAVPDPLTVSISGPNVLSFGEEGTFVAHASGASGVYTYRWYRDGYDTGVTTPTYTTPAYADFELRVDVASGNQAQSAWALVSVYGGENCDPDVICVAPMARAAAIPSEFALHAPSPNPARGRVEVAFDLPAGAPVRLAVYDLLGREVARLADGAHSAGYHRATLDAGALPAGVYLVRVEAGPHTATRRFTVVR